MPIFRLSRAFSIARNVKVFLNLESGVTRGAVPDVVEPYKEKTDDLRNARKKISRQRKMLESKDHEIFRLKNELRAMKKRVESTSDGRSTPQVVSELETGALPDFVIIGAQRCGTSSLYHLLTRHPNVERAASKELHYFDRRFDDKDIDWYRRCFAPPSWKDGRRSITGEATPEYLLHPLVPERMMEVLPQARLIVLLRNPVDRAYSGYHQMVRKGLETRGFEEAIEAEKTWLLSKEEGRPSEHEPGARAEHPPSDTYLEGGMYLERGIYVDQLLRWSKFYSDEQMLVLKSEDFFERTTDTLKLVLDFLDLPDWEPETLVRNKVRYKQKMTPATRRRLEDFFELHNQRLYEYLGVDFGW